MEGLPRSLSSYPIIEGQKSVREVDWFLENFLSPKLAMMKDKG